MHSVEIQANVGERVDFLRSVPFFDCLQPRELWFLAQNARCQRAPRGTVIFHEAAPARELWLIRRGGVKLFQNQPGGPPFTIRFIGPQAPVGIDAVVQQPAYSISAVTLCWSSLMVWSSDVLLSVMQSNPLLSINAMRILSTRIEDFRARYRELTNERVETRLARALVRAYSQWVTVGDATFGGADPEKHPPVELPVSRRDLADIAGTTFCTVSRLIQHWQRLEILRAGRMRITVFRPTALPAQLRDACMPETAVPPVLAKRSRQRTSDVAWQLA